MKRILIMGGLTTALAIAAIAPAQAARTTHVGKLVGVPGSQVKFKEAVADDGSTVTSFAVRNFTVACDDGTEGILKVAKLTGSVEVSAAGAFKVSDDNGETVFKVSGAINRNKSFGRFRYFGEIAGSDGSTHSCDSGRLAWVTRP